MNDFGEKLAQPLITGRAPDAIIEDLILPILESELGRLYALAMRHHLDAENTNHLVKLARATVAIKDSATRARGVGVGREDLERMTPDELWAMAARLLKEKGLNPDQLWGKNERQ